MNRAQKIIEAYRNTPWRKQIQMLGLFAAFGVVAAVVMIVYVWVTSLAGAYGLQVQEYQATAQALEQVIEDKNAQLADLTSVENLAARADEQNYVPVDPNRIRYIEAAEPQPVQPQLPQEFTTSLIDWIREMIYLLSLETGAINLGGE